MKNDEGRVNHGELVVGDGLVMVGEPGGGYENPNKRGGRATAGVNVYVDDVDAHFERAKAAGREDQRGAVRPGVRRPPLHRGGPGGTRLVLLAAVESVGQVRG